MGEKYAPGVEEKYAPGVEEKYAPGVEEKYEVSCPIPAPGVGCTIVQSGWIFLNVRYLVQIRN